jgi:phosphoglycolate phosphatase
MLFAAVLFDFDGTLADSYPAIAASVNYVRAGHGLPPLPVEEVKRHVGRGPEYLLTHTVPNSDLQADLACYRAHHPTVMVQGTHLLPGAAEALAYLKGAGKRVGLCSNKPRNFSQNLLQHLEVASIFDIVLGPEDVAHLKPAPDMLQTAMARLGLTPPETLYVGDMTVDIETARGAGVTVWIVPTGSQNRATLEAAHPDRLLTSLHDLCDAFQAAG